MKLKVVNVIFLMIHSFWDKWYITKWIDQTYITRRSILVKISFFPVYC